MRILAQPRSQKELLDHIQGDTIVDYVYMYPPRQAYRSLIHSEIQPLIEASLGRFEDINLYFHFPFCRQVCAFCNLFSYVCEDDILFSHYIDCMKQELSYYLPWISGKRVATIYLGGGTPSLLPSRLLYELFDFLEKKLAFSIDEVAEVSLEVSPDTVEEHKFRSYKEIGINRVNIGIQSIDDGEIGLIGRHYCTERALAALATLQEVGFENICVDLIYGLQGQTQESWRRSVETVIGYQPETVCAYALTLRPFTGFDRRGYKSLQKTDQYSKYDFANSALRAAGYMQETHVRWAKSRIGGYIQKANHWALRNILGIGAGARSYLWHCDFRNGYSVRNRFGVFQRYLHDVAEYGHGRSEGFITAEHEKRRKALILGLMKLDRNWFRQEFGEDPVVAFHDEIESLLSLGLLSCDHDFLRLSDLGIRHRDVVVQTFFSSEVRELVRSYEYDE